MSVLDTLKDSQREYNMRHHEWVMNVEGIRKRKQMVKLNKIYAASYLKWKDYFYDDIEQITPPPIPQQLLTACWGSDDTCDMIYRPPETELPILVRAYLGLLSDKEAAVDKRILNDSWTINLRGTL